MSPVMLKLLQKHTRCVHPSRAHLINAHGQCQWCHATLDELSLDVIHEVFGLKLINQDGKPKWVHIDQEMKVGAVVMPNSASRSKGHILFCGSGRYDVAVVASINPFILVSEGGDMMWAKTWKPKELTVINQASPEVMKVVMTRLELGH